MSLDAIKSITKSEERAKRAKQDSAAEAKRMLAQADEKGEAVIKAAKQKAVDELRELGRKADEKAAADAVSLAGSTENKKAAMRARAESNLDRAAMIIVERVVNG